MKILTINCGSSSIKFQLIETETELPLCWGSIFDLDGDTGVFECRNSLGGHHYKRDLISSHRDGIKRIATALTDPEIGGLAALSEIAGIGHRVVHGGEEIVRSELITQKIEEQIERCIPLAPLHNPHSLEGYRVFKEIVPDIPMVAVFDTSFHSSLREETYLFALPLDYHRRHGIRRFGFHGISHNYITLRAAKMLGVEEQNLNLISCHLGGGVSIVAIRGGRPVDTSLGFGTMCGVPMATRAGDIDPDVVLMMLEKLKMSPGEIRELLYNGSGLLGLSGQTGNVGKLVEAIEEGSSAADLAISVFCHRVRHYISALAANLEGRMDALVFTAGIGENVPVVRERACSGLEILGVQLDPARNRVTGVESVLSTDDSRVKVLLIPTNEELMIAKETCMVIAKL